MNVLIVGYKGFIGEAIHGALRKNDFFYVQGKDRRDPYPDGPFDTVIHANGNSRKFWANKNPLTDFDESVRSIFETILNYPDSDHILISSIDSNINNIYGKNKKLAEKAVLFYCSKAVILRCSAVIGKNMKKGVVYDILYNRPVFLTEDSCLQFITRDEIGRIIMSILIRQLKTQKSKIYNLVGKGCLSIKEIGNILNKDIIYNEELERQRYDFTASPGFQIKTSYDYVKDLINERVE